MNASSAKLFRQILELTDEESLPGLSVQATRGGEHIIVIVNLGLSCPPFEEHCAGLDDAAKKIRAYFRKVQTDCETDLVMISDFVPKKDTP